MAARLAERIGRARRAGVAMLFAAALAGCAGTEEIEYVERPVAELYDVAMDELADGNWTDGAAAFDEVERQHPYSVWATKAQIMAAYAHYQQASPAQADEYDAAISSATRFITLHPGHRDVAYAYYLIALSYYEQISDVGRDQKMTEDALRWLEDIVRRFPGTAYARDAKLKIDLARDHLAGKGMEVGRFYLQRGQYVAAINRFRRVIENEEFQTTTHVPEALHRLAEAYLALGVVEEAQTAAAVLGYNFPGSEWYRDSYALLDGRDLEPRESERSWISRAWNSVF